MLGRSLAVLVAANVLNNRVAPRLAPLTSVVAVAALVAMARRSGHTWDELGFHRLSRGAKVGGVLAAAVAGVYGAGVAIPQTRPFFQDQRALSLSRARVLEEALLQVPVGTVLLEEVAFRGVLHGHLAGRHGHRVATALSSLLFGLWHILPAIDMARANPALAELSAGRAVPPAYGGGTGGADPGASDPAGSEGGRTAGPVGPGPGRAAVVRTVAGTVVVTGLAGALLCELRRRNGLLGPSLLHLATNSLGYAFARLSASASDGS
ncbi:CPBP family intramembrane glutamic endopeptidase [Sinosporangium album]|uniref:CPBP family intramembrane glutamic endopeptidase n=1 Tax=Sinosporangium album TaxID=504805 RepID=UPI001FE19DD5|nr:CPBP family intramembrane glutamic endopeptidase [Sinosporangium album]